MATCTIDQVIRARRSAKVRKRTLRKVYGRWMRSLESPLVCGGAFEDSISRIEREYDEMLGRIKRATVTL